MLSPWPSFLGILYSLCRWFYPVLCFRPIDALVTPTSIYISSLGLSLSFPSAYTTLHLMSNSIIFIDCWISYPLLYPLQLYWFPRLLHLSKYYCHLSVARASSVGDTFKIHLDLNTWPPLFNYHHLTPKLLQWSPNWSLFFLQPAYHSPITPLYSLNYSSLVVSWTHPSISLPPQNPCILLLLADLLLPQRFAGLALSYQSVLHTKGTLKKVFFDSPN